VFAKLLMIKALIVFFLTVVKIRRFQQSVQYKYKLVTKDIWYITYKFNEAFYTALTLVCFFLFLFLIWFFFFSFYMHCPFL